MFLERKKSRIFATSLQTNPKQKMKQSNLLSTFWLPALLACFSLFACKGKQGAKSEQIIDNQTVTTPKTEKGVAGNPVVIQMPRPMPGPAQASHWP